MFVVHENGKSPFVGGLAGDRKVVFLAKTEGGDYCIITAPLDFRIHPNKPQEKSLEDLSLSGLVAYLGKACDFKEIKIENACRISDRCFAHGNEFAFSYHGKNKLSREYSLAGNNFKEIYIRL